MGRGVTAFKVNFILIYRPIVVYIMFVRQISPAAAGGVPFYQIHFAVGGCCFVCLGSSGKGLLDNQIYSV